MIASRSVRLRAREPVADRRDGVAALVAVHRHLDLFPELLELVDRGRALQVCRDERGLLAVLAEEQRELRGGRRLARPLQPGEQDHGRLLGGVDEARVAGAHQRGQLVVDDLDDLLARGDRLDDVVAHRALADLRREVLHDIEIHVCFEQRKADLAHRAGNRLLVECPALPEIAECALKAVGERVEHGGRSVLAALRSPGYA